METWLTVRENMNIKYHCLKVYFKSDMMYKKYFKLNINNNGIICWNVLWIQWMYILIHERKFLNDFLKVAYKHQNWTLKMFVLNKHLNTDRGEKPFSHRNITDKNLAIDIWHTKRKNSNWWQTAIKYPLKARTKYI